MLGLIESRDKIIQEKEYQIILIFNSLKILKLRQMNEKLVKELKTLTSNLDKSIEKSRMKQKPINPYTDANIKGKLFININIYK